MVLITVQPGPTVIMWKDGVEIGRVKYTPARVLRFIRELIDQSPI